MGKTFSHNVRIYYEDTDLASVVYYANYLKFAERARTEMLREVGVNQSDLGKGEQVFFMVKECKINYKGSARLDDELCVGTQIIEVKAASFLLKQQIFLREKLITDIDVLIVSVNDEFQVVKVPSNIRKRLVL
ncbi:MAG: YbgC/FadM family acyl-CoA thioesterase [Rickettsiales bacterium]|jgi:acyl-CoA thioester hydrolase|nr:YbgC/FadM family acyl-CoA thioesterase [Rickettsiales bacterium]